MNIYVRAKFLMEGIRSVFQIVGLPLSLAFCLVAVSGCATTASLEQAIVNNRPVTTGKISGITVVRGGTRLPVTAGMALQANDSIQTDSRSTGVLSFPGGTRITLFPGGKVKVGSLWVYFGEILANIRGHFVIESEGGTAGVEGTEFFLRKSGGTEMEITVIEGRVRLTSKTNKRSVVVNPSERGTLPRGGTPSIHKIDRASMKRVIERANRAKELQRHPRPRPAPKLHIDLDLIPHRARTGPVAPSVEGQKRTPNPRRVVE